MYMNNMLSLYQVPDISEYLTLSKTESLHSTGSYRWLKFDDEFVIEVPKNSLPQSLVTGFLMELIVYYSWG